MPKEEFLLPCGSNGKENLPVMQGAGFDPRSGKILLRKGMAIHSVFFPGGIPGTEKPWRATAHGVANSLTRLSN